MSTEAKPSPVAAVEEAVAGYSDEEKPLFPYLALVGAYNAALAGVLIVARASGRPIPRLGFGDLLLFGAATHKLSRRVAKDKVTAPLRAPFTEYQEPGGPAEVEEKPRGSGAKRAIGELVLCPYCLDQWIGTAFVSGSIFAPRVTRLVAGLFTSVGIADFLHVAYKASQKRL